MRYFVMEPLENIGLPSVPKGENSEVVIASNLSRFGGVDYDANSKLISDRFKLLVELYMPNYDFVPVVFFEPAKEKQAVYWRFKPQFYTNYQALFRNDGIVSHISFPDNRAPFVFTVRSHKGIQSIVVRMAVAESALRRNILGLKFSTILN